MTRPYKLYSARYQTFTKFPRRQVRTQISFALIIWGIHFHISWLKPIFFFLSWVHLCASLGIHEHVTEIRNVVGKTTRWWNESQSKVYPLTKGSHADDQKHFLFCSCCDVFRWPPHFQQKWLQSSPSYPVYKTTVKVTLSLPRLVLCRSATVSERLA